MQVEDERIMEKDNDVVIGTFWENNLDRIFGMNVMIFRKKRGMTQSELADKIGVTRSCIASWEGGQRHPDLTILVRLSLVFNVGINELLEENTYAN